MTFLEKKVFVWIPVGFALGVFVMVSEINSRNCACGFGSNKQIDSRITESKEHLRLTLF